MEGRPEREETVITTEAPSQPHDDDLDIVLDPDHPERSIVIVRRPPLQRRNRRNGALTCR